MTTTSIWRRSLSGWALVRIGVALVIFITIAGFFEFRDGAPSYAGLAISSAILSAAGEEYVFALIGAVLSAPVSILAEAEKERPIWGSFGWLVLSFVASVAALIVSSIVGTLVLAAVYQSTSLVPSEAITISGWSAATLALFALLATSQSRRR